MLAHVDSLAHQIIPGCRDEWALCIYPAAGPPVAQTAKVVAPYAAASAPADCYPRNKVWQGARLAHARTCTSYESTRTSSSCPLGYGSLSCREWRDKVFLGCLLDGPVLRLGWMTPRSRRRLRAVLHNGVLQLRERPGLAVSCWLDIPIKHCAPACQTGWCGGPLRRRPTTSQRRSRERDMCASYRV